MTGATSYDRLHPEVQRWIRDQGWRELRQVQDRAIDVILGGTDDVLITAATAAGKTEAAFLPLLGLAAVRTTPGLAILYVAPLKALINDQGLRLADLCDRLDLPLVRWHGDAPPGPKSRLLKAPRGVVLITPESIEAMLIRRPVAAGRLFARLEAVVIDELHAFLRGPRGLHLASLLRRVDLLSSERPARRVGLSATIGDPALAAAWLRPGAPDAVLRVESEGGQPELRLQVRGHREREDRVGTDAVDADGRGDDGASDALSEIADHAWRQLRGSNNLFFAGSRRNVEDLADRLRRRSEAAGVPNPFLPHHGNLSRDLREEVETRLKKGTEPTTAVATTTLELGIDIGSVASIAQLGAPRSLAGLRQRLGRSGRRDGTPAVLRIYIRESAAPDDLLGRLRLSTVRAVAAVQLLLARFVEPSERHDPALLSVAVQQTLSIIVERGGMTPTALHQALVAHPPLMLPAAEFAQLLRGMAAPAAALIEQSPDGLVMLGREGERITTSRDFYANFETDEEWRIVAAGRSLGTIPLANAVAVGGMIGFAGRRWRILGVDDHAKVIDVTRHPSALPPVFDPATAEPIHDRLAAEMRKVLDAEEEPGWLDGPAAALLEEGRSEWCRQDLRRGSLLRSGDATHLMTWRGTVFNELLAVVLTAGGCDAEGHDVGIEVVGKDPAELLSAVAHLRETLAQADLAKAVGALSREKYDRYVPDGLLRAHWRRRHEHLLPDVDAFLPGLGGR